MYDEVKNKVNEIPAGDSILADIAAMDFLDEAKTTVPENEDNLRRWGFQYAIKEKFTGQTSAENLLQEYKERKIEELNRWQVIYDAIQDRYQEKIEFIKDEIQRLSSGKLLYDPTKSDLKLRKDELENEIREYFEKIVEVRKRMVVAKQDMMGKCMDDAEAHIARALELQKKMYDETKIINQQEFADSKETLDTHISQWTAKREKYQERQDEVNNRMKLINADGVNPSTAYILIGIGTSVAAAAGYFFSVFTSTANFSSQDAFFFLLNGFLKAGGTNDIGFLYKIGLLVLFVLLTGVISYLCYRLFKHFFGKKETLKEDYIRFDAYSRIVKDNHSISAKAKAGSWFSFWLQAAPLVIILGVVVLLLALNKTTADDLMRLNSSLEGVLTGTAVALGIGGLMCLYIMKIIEPRLLQRQNEGKGILNWLKYNWELAACMLSFLVFTIAIIFFPLSNGQLSNQSTNAIAIPEFIVVSLLSAFPFAYGVRFRGLIAVNRFLQKEIDRLDYIIAEWKTPEKPYLNGNYAKVSEIVVGLLGVIQNRVILLNKGDDAVIPVLPATKDERTVVFLWKTLNNIRKGLRNLFNTKNKKEASSVDKLIHLTEWEQSYFPDVDEEIKLLGTACIEKEQEYRKVINQLDKLDAEYSLHEEEVEEKTKKLQKDIETLLTYKEKAAASKIKKFARINLLSIHAETAILDGFHLGIWYRENQMGPVDDYYVNTPFYPEDSNKHSIKFLGNGNI